MNKRKIYIILSLGLLVIGFFAGIFLPRAVIDIANIANKESISATSDESSNNTEKAISIDGCGIDIIKEEEIDGQHAMKIEGWIATNFDTDDRGVYIILRGPEYYSIPTNSETREDVYDFLQQNGKQPSIKDHGFIQFVYGKEIVDGHYDISLLVKNSTSEIEQRTEYSINVENGYIKPQ